MILLIDNYDSFVHNLARYFMRLGQTTSVIRNDAVDGDSISAMRPRAIVISPGPCTPKEAGCTEAVISAFCDSIPILGVCLGHQSIATALGGTIRPADQPMHGRTSLIEHDGAGVFSELPNPMQVCRYHSLVVDEAKLPDCLVVTARTPDGVPMAIAHRNRPTVGVQFHPESILTDHGYQLLANFLVMADIPATDPLPTMNDEFTPASSSEADYANVTYTF